MCLAHLSTKQYYPETLNIRITVRITFKIDKLEMLIAGSEPDIIMITEVLPEMHCNSISAARLA